MHVNTRNENFRKFPSPGGGDRHLVGLWRGAGYENSELPLRFRRPFMLGERFHLASQTSVF